MNTIISNKIYIKKASQEVYWWCRDNLVVTNPLWSTLYKLGKMNQISRCHVPEKMYLYVENGMDLILPSGCLRAIWPLIKDSPVELDFNNDKKINCINTITQPLFDYQEEAVQKMIQAKSGILIGSCGSGKGLPLDTPVATPTGWIRNGDLKIGDYVLGRNGKPTKVIGIFDRGLQPCYKITFNDNNEVICDSSHLWNIQTNKHRLLADGKFETVDTEYLFKNLHKKRDNNGFVPMVEPVEYEKKDVPIDPWALGILLGDGSFSEKDMVLLSNSEEDLISNFINTFGENGVTICRENPKRTAKTIVLKKETNVKENLKKMELLGKKSYEKFIPDIYKYNSIDVRWKVIQGLFDTDGSVCLKGLKSGSLEFSTTSYQLALDFKEIIESVGGICKLKERKTHFTYKGVKKEGRTSYRLAFFVNNNLLPFTTKKHTSRWNPHLKYRSAYRVIKKIEKVEPQVTRCIKVDASDSLYVIKNYIVTHNTNCGIEIAKRIGLNCLWLCHTKDLLKQTVARIKKLYPSMHVGTITEGKVDMVQDGITVSTVQTLVNVDSDIYVTNFGTVIVDEAHHIVGSESLMKHFTKVISKIPARYKFGLTATDARNDTMTKSMYAYTGANLDGEFEPVWRIDRKETKTLTARHEKVELYTQFDFSMLNDDGTFNYINMVDYLSKNEYRNEEICKKIVEMQKEGRKQLVLCARIEQCEILLNKLLDLGVKAELLVGKVSGKKREKVLGDSSNWDVIVATVSLAKEGLDVVDLDTLHLASCISNKSDTVQSVGRIERYKDEKNEPIVFDYVDINIAYTVGKYKKRAGWLKRR